MAEVIAIVASAIQVADFGFRLSKSIYSYTDAHYSADKRLKDMALDVKLTCNVVKELGDVFKHPATQTLKKDNAVSTAQETIGACESVFHEIEQAIDEAGKSRLLQPFRQPKLDILNANLDKLKGTLMLLVAVLQHAYHIASDEEKRGELKELMRAKNEAEKKLQCLQQQNELILKNTHLQSPTINGAEWSQTLDPVVFSIANVASPNIDPPGPRQKSQSHDGSSLSSATMDSSPSPDEFKSITSGDVDHCLNIVQELLNDIRWVQKHWEEPAFPPLDSSYFSRYSHGEITTALGKVMLGHQKTEECAAIPCSRTVLYQKARADLIEHRFNKHPEPAKPDQKQTRNPAEAAQVHAQHNPDSMGYCYPSKLEPWAPSWDLSSDRDSPRYDHPSLPPPPLQQRFDHASAQPSTLANNASATTSQQPSPRASHPPLHQSAHLRASQSSDEGRHSLKSSSSASSTHRASTKAASKAGKSQGSHQRLDFAGQLPERHGCMGDDAMQNPGPVYEDFLAQDHNEKAEEPSPKAKSIQGHQKMPNTVQPDEAKAQQGDVESGHTCGAISPTSLENPPPSAPMQQKTSISSASAIAQQQPAVPPNQPAQVPAPSGNDNVSLTITSLNSALTALQNRAFNPDFDLDFGSMDSGVVLENFDFHTFLHSGIDNSDAFPFDQTFLNDGLKTTTDGTDNTAATPPQTSLPPTANAIAPHPQPPTPSASTHLAPQPPPTHTNPVPNPNPPVNPQPATATAHPPAPPHPRAHRRRRPRTRPTLGDSVLLSFLDPNHPDIARAAGERALNSDSDIEESADESQDERRSGLAAVGPRPGVGVHALLWDLPVGGAAAGVGKRKRGGEEEEEGRSGVKRACGEGCSGGVAEGETGAIETVGLAALGGSGIGGGMGDEAGLKRGAMEARERRMAAGEGDAVDELLEAWTTVYDVGAAAV